MSAPARIRPQVAELPSRFQKLERLSIDLSSGRYAGGAAIAEVDLFMSDSSCPGSMRLTLQPIKAGMLAGQINVNTAAASFMRIVQARKQKDEHEAFDRAEREASYRLARETHDLINPRPVSPFGPERDRLIVVSNEKSLAQPAEWRVRRDKLVKFYEERYDLIRNGGRGPSQVDIYGQYRTIDNHSQVVFDQASNELKKHDPTYPVASYYRYS